MPLPKFENSRIRYKISKVFESMMQRNKSKDNLKCIILPLLESLEAHVKGKLSESMLPAYDSMCSEGDKQDRFFELVSFIEVLFCFFPF